MRNDLLLKGIAADADNWIHYYNAAKACWQAYQLEKAVKVCLAYLHRQLQPPPYLRQSLRCQSPLTIILAAGGSGERWLNFTGRPKQLVDTGDGLPLIQRTIHLLSHTFQDAAIHTLVGPEQRSHYGCIKQTEFLERVRSPDSSLYLELIDVHISQRFCDTNVLWLHGDVCWSEPGVKLLRRAVDEADGLMVFGRKRRNDEYGNNGGEDFGWYLPAGCVAQLRGWYLLAQELYLAAPLFRLTTWEVVSLMSLALRTGAAGPQDLRARYRDPLALSRAMADVFAKRDFPPGFWVEINDATEDFDFPVEYLNRLLLMVERVGRGSWS